MDNKILIAIVALVVIGAGAWYLFNAGGPATDEDAAGDEPVAVVNGEEIPRRDLTALESQVAAEQNIDPATLDEQEKAGLRAQALDTLIAQALLRQAAQESGITAEDAQIDEQVGAISARFQNEGAFEEALEAEGLTQETLRTRVAGELATQAYLEQELALSEVSATEEEVDAAYQEIAAEGEVPPLEEVRGQVEDLVIQQKSQELIRNHVEELRAEAEIQILI